MTINFGLKLGFGLTKCSQTFGSQVTGIVKPVKQGGATLDRPLLIPVVINLILSASQG